MMQKFHGAGDQISLVGSGFISCAPSTTNPYQKGLIVIKFGFGVLVGITISPVARPYIVKKLDDLDLKLRVKAAEARDRANGF